MATVEYAEDQRPCLVARKPCGCYVAACVLSENILTELGRLGSLSTNAPTILDFIREGNSYGSTYEVRPISFVRTGGLTFDCEHSAEAQKVAG